MEKIKAALEAILMVAEEPVDAGDISRVLSDSGMFENEEIHTERDLASDNGRAQYVEDVLDSLAKEYNEQGRGFELHHSLRGWQLMSAQEFEQVVAHYVADGQTARLSQAALEALAIIAYKQPITRAQVAAIRGVNSDGVIRSLTVRGLIREHGTDVQTHAALLVTSGLFLDKMGLNDLAELPSLAPFLPDYHDYDSDDMSHL